MRLWRSIATAVLLLATLLPPALAQSDPHLEPGFPVKAFATGGIHHRGPALHTLVGNIDADPELEIVVTGIAGGPLYAWNHDGSLVDGWPVSNRDGAAYPVLGQIANDDAALEVFASYMACCQNADLVTFDGDGKPTPGWPRLSTGWTATPPSAVDIDGDGLDELFIEEEAGGFLHGYTAEGRVLRGWPQDGGGTQDMHTPAIGDLDGGGDLEVVSATGWNSAGMYLNAWHHDGARVAGFPVHFQDSSADTFPVLGDVDGDGKTEIVAVVGGPHPPEGRQPDQIAIISKGGAVERRIDLGVFAGFTAPALADLTGDGVPEIIVQAGNRLVVTTGSGGSLPGWPVDLGDFQKEDSSPVVGDVNGDGQLDIAITVQNWNTHEGQIRVYDKNGSMLAGFPKTVPQLGSGGVPAIADIDLDGRNELIVSGLNWQGVTGMLDRVWVYDLKGPGPYGPVPWGQFGGDASHSSSYPLATKKWPTPAPTIRGHERSVTMRMRGHIVLKGRVTSELPSCAKGVPVRHQRWLSSYLWESPIGPRTDSEGRYRIEISDGEERYRVALPFAWRGKNDSQVCLRATSRTLDHRH